MKIIKKLAAVMLVAVMSLSITACNAGNVGNAEGTENAANAESDKDSTIIARVGDVNIAKKDLDMSMAQTDAYLQMYYGADFKSNPDFIPNYNSILDQNVQQLIGYEILIMKARENDAFKVGADEIDKQLTSIKVGYATDDEFNQALTTAGMTLDELKKSIEKDLYYQKIVDSYKEKVEVTDAEIKDYYDQNIASFTQAAGANISHILVKTEEEANQVLDKYNAGESFADLAAQYGTDGTKSQGGSLGYIPYNTQSYDADFMAGAKALGEGEVSKPVKTQFGWHLIKVDGIQKEDVVKPLEEVSDQIKSSVIEQKSNEAISKDVESWKADYEIKTYTDRYQIPVPETTTSDAAAGQADQAATDTSSEASK